MPEKLIRVTSESELRIGMMVVEKPCRGCGMPHMFMLLGRTRGMYRGEIRDGWKSHPRVGPCDQPKPSYIGLFFGNDIHEGRLFRVDDGLEEMDRKAHGREERNAKARERRRWAKEGAR